VKIKFELDDVEMVNINILIDRCSFWYCL